MMFNEQQTILVTGASSGIGEGIALHLNSLGATVLACARNSERLNLVQSKAKNPQNWHSIIFDLVENMEEISAWLTALRTQYGKLWGLVHCAGEGLMDSLQLYNLDVARKHFDLNFHVPMLLAQAFSDKRTYQKNGAMLFLASSSAVYPEKGHLLYGAAKSALVTAAKVISQEVAPRGLRVHCLSPGIIDTPLQKEAEKALTNTYRDEQLARYPLGFGTPDDIASMAAFLLSHEARWLTGQNYVMGGGCY